ncbi:MAG: hypothetical protein LKE48_03385 [Solobacterium sp.]|jgi:predicted Holliday junction resolvase-like endonuclease|nr:hypothetical protein [Solobacterium sp.]MCH4281548.1 hypothetical protein [Solobacterium sp.]
MADQYIVTALIIAIVIMVAALIAIVILIRGLQRDIESLEETVHELSEYRKGQSMISNDHDRAIRDINDRLNMLESLHCGDLIRFKSNQANYEKMRMDPNKLKHAKRTSND